MSTDTTQPHKTGRWWMPLAVIAAAALVVGVFFMTTNNRLVGLQENVHTAWAQVETVLQRRFDLIPNLVATVKGYAEHEQETLEEVTRLRSQWGQAKTVDEKAQTASALDSALSRLLVVSERYPDLKASQNFRDLQVELSGTENRVSVERQRYNEAVRAYNTAVRSFPTKLIASTLGFSADSAYFEAANKAQEAPKVDFSKPDEASKES